MTDSKEYKDAIQIKAEKILKHIHFLLAVATILWINMGVVNYFEIITTPVIGFGIFFLWLLIAFLERSYFTKLFKSSWMLLMAYFIIMFFSIFFPNENMDLYASCFNMLVIIYSIFLYYFEDKYKKQQKLLVYAILLDFLFVAIVTYIQLDKVPQLSRWLAAGINENLEEYMALIDNELTFSGIGSYSFAYSLVPIVLIAVYDLIKSKRKNLILNIIIIIFGIIMILKMDYTLALLLLILFSGVIILYGLTSKKMRFLLIPILGLFLILIYVVLPDILISVAHSRAIEAATSARLIELSNALRGVTDSGSDLASRMSFYLESVDQIIKSPIVGTLFMRNANDSIGQHSTILDFLAVFGLFSFFFFGFLVQNFHYMCKKLGSDKKYITSVIWLFFLILSLINTSTWSQLYITMFLIVPFYLNSGRIDWETRKENDNEGSLADQHHSAENS